MEHSIIVLVALVLLIVFAGFQMQKLFDLFRADRKSELTTSLKTVVKADTLPLKGKKITTRKKNTPKAKRGTKTAKKSEGAKK